MSPVSRTQDTYTISAALVHRLILSITASLLTFTVAVAGYMISWNKEDKAWKTKQDERLGALVANIAALRKEVDEGILPRADERIKALEKQMRHYHNPTSPYGPKPRP